MRRAAGLTLAALFLGGCSLIRLPGTETGVATAPGSRPVAEELVDYLGGLRGMNESRLAAEAARQRKGASGERADIARLKAALALTLAGASDESEILALVEPVARRSGADPQATAMANFLQALATERRRLKESAGAATTKLRDERRAAEQQRQRADALQERANELQQKLDALSELEKSLSNREPPSR